MDLLLSQSGLLVARTLHFWALAPMVGGAGFLLLLKRPVGAPAMQVLRLASLVVSLSGLAWFACVYVDVTGDPAALLDRDDWIAFVSASFGPPWAIRLGLLVVVLALPLSNSPFPFLFFGCLLAIDQTWLGHAAAGIGSSAPAQIAFYAIHVLAGLTWVGALMMLCVVGFAERRVPRDGLKLFSDGGMTIVAAIIASGIVNASFRLRSASELATTPYGQLLCAKLALFVGMAALAVFNRHATRLDNETQPALALGVGLEACLGLAALCVAAVLGVSPPP